MKAAKLLLACVMGTCLILATFATAHAGTVVGLWHMDEDSGSTMQDSSGNNNDGNLTDVTLGLPGVSGTAYGFNGSTSIATVPSSDSLNPGNADIVLTAHVKFTGPFLDDSYDIIRKGKSATAGGEYKMEIMDSGQLKCLFKGNAGTADKLGGSGQPALADGQWHTIQCLRSGTTVTARVDGFSTSAHKSSGSITNTAPLRVGAKIPGDDVYNGVMDEVSIEFTPLVDPTPTPTPTPTPSGQSCLGSPATIVGTSAGETLTGTDGDDVIYAGGGNDVVEGLGGNDRLCGVGGADQVSGGDGNDRSSGGAGNDTVTDQSGTDILQGNSHADSLNASDGQAGDTVNGGLDPDTCTVDAGDKVSACETIAP
jgi:Ca2+-binding RTX toxin-like protein